jgi:DNA helicase-2/ATP-dependent DNA helicase PcrA
MIYSVMEAMYRDHLHATYPDSERRLEDLEILRETARAHGDLEEFLSQMALMTNLETSDNGRRDQNSVQLSTIHQAKGLEWPVVFVIWLTEGMFPSSRSAEDPECLAEERRLFYVAVTRAMDRLYLTWPRTRPNAADYRDIQQRPSRFLEEIDQDLLESVDR